MRRGCSSESMKFVFWNAQGFGALAKCFVVKVVMKTIKADIILLHKAKINDVRLSLIMSIFPRSRVLWIAKEAVGFTGRFIIACF